MMNKKECMLIMTLLNNFQMMKMCMILRMVFHSKIKTDCEVNYLLCGRVISLYYIIIIIGRDA